MAAKYLVIRKNPHITTFFAYKMERKKRVKRILIVQRYYDVRNAGNLPQQVKLLQIT